MTPGLLLFYVLIFWPPGMWGLSSLTRNRTHIPCMGRRRLNPWTIRDIPPRRVINMAFVSITSWLCCDFLTSVSFDTLLCLVGTDCSSKMNHPDLLCSSHVLSLGKAGGLPCHVQFPSERPLAEWDLWVSGLSTLMFSHPRVTPFCHVLFLPGSPWLSLCSWELSSITHSAQ